MDTIFTSTKFKIFRETIVLVLLILITKTLLSHYGWEFISTSSLLTSIISGSIFVLGFILSGTYRDYKESEYVPVSISAAIESMHNDAILFKKEYKKFDYATFTTTLKSILDLFKKDLLAHTKKSYFKTNELTLAFDQLGKLGVPANYIVKLKQDQNTILRGILRVNYIQKIQPIPSAYILVQSIVIGLMLILLFTKLDSIFNELIAVGFISFIFIYMLKLIKVLEKPFHEEGSTMDDVSLFHLKEQQTRLAKEK
ncbi:MAG: hypothetical protein H0W89_05620 [Candidatus Levybacteria bacterium]|nr:hypothetical protein [Candidatus Levybacteria bacterium]